MSWKYGGSVIFRQPKLLVSPCQLAHPQGCKSTSWLLPGLTTLKVPRHEAIVGNLSDEEGKALQDEHREDTRDEAVRDIERNYSKFKSVLLVKERQGGRDIQGMRMIVKKQGRASPYQNMSVPLTSYTDERHTI